MPTTGLLASLVAGGRIEKHRIALALQAEFPAVALDIQPDGIAPSTLTIEAPFAPPRRVVDGKIVVGGSRAATLLEKPQISGLETGG